MPTSLQQGINFAKAGQTEKALEHLKDAIIEEPQNADVWVWLAAIIDDPEKQEIFLNNALEIDPKNIPAQRGMSYLEKRRRHDEDVKGETLADYTQPISPFPRMDAGAKPVRNNREPLGKSHGWVNLAIEADRNGSNHVAEEAPQQNLRLTALEIVLLCIVVIVFAFIGLLASSALFNFELPWEVLSGSRPRLITEPPYQGAFLYEDGVYFDIQQHQGPPVANVGIPTSSSPQPVIAFWQMDVEMSSINLIHESGAYVNYRSYRHGRSAELIQPSTELQDGLYCLQETNQTQSSNMGTFYCFQIDHSLME